MDELLGLLRRYARGIWQHRWIAVALAWVICVAGWAFVWSIPNTYEADARLYVDADAILTPLLRGIALDSSSVSQVDILQRTLLSRPNLEKLVAKTDLELGIRQPADRDRVVATLQSAIHIVPQTKNLFSIVYRNSSPRLALDVVQQILAIFIESKTGTNREGLENARLFLTQQIASYEQQLRETEAKRADFRAKYLDLLPDASGGNSRLENARASVRSLEGALADATGKRDRIAAELATTPATLTTELEPAVAAGAGGGRGGCPERESASRKLDEMRITLTDDHPDVKRQRQVLDTIKCGGGGGGAPGRAARNRTTPNPLHDQLKVLIVQADGEVASLRRQVEDATRERDRLESAARNAPGVQAQYLNLNRDYEVVHKNYDELLTRREAMRISAAADTDADKVKLQVIDPPQLPRIPVAPKRSLLLSGVLAAGLAGGLGVGLVLSQLDRSFHTVRELRGLGLPVAGAISYLVPAGARRGTWRAVSAAAVGLAVALLCVIYGGLMYRVLVGGVG